jgi:K+-sensing histidine kinase KdpD
MVDPRDDPKLLSLAVHELRTPVSVISGYLRMLLRHFGSNLTEQQRKIIQDSERSCGTLSSMIADLSDLANLEAGHLTVARERVNLVPLLGETAAAASNDCDRSLVLDLHLPDGPAWVDGDQLRLRDAFTTIFTAVLRERVSSEPIPAHCIVREHGGRPFVHVAIGVSPASHAAIDGTASDRDVAFDEYRGGLGFRLVLGARLVKALGGHIVSPNTARGAFSIVVSLPLSET